MKKAFQIFIILIPSILIFFLAFFSKEPEQKGELTEVYEEDVQEEEWEASDYRSQLKVLSENYSYWNDKYDELNDRTNNMLVAVTDLNRNGRLELIISDLQGNRNTSYTEIFEISPDYSSIEIMMNDNGSERDMIGDFISQTRIRCYEKDGKYFYLIKDRNCAETGGMARDMFYLYSFDGFVKEKLLGGYVLSPIRNTDVIQTKFLNYNAYRVESENAFKSDMEAYLSNYKVQPTCKMSWESLPDKEDCLATLSRSYLAFNTEFEDIDEEFFDYKQLFGDGYNYVIQRGDELEVIKDYIKTELDEEKYSSFQRYLPLFEEDAKCHYFILNDDCSFEDLRIYYDKDSFYISNFSLVDMNGDGSEELIMHTSLENGLTIVITIINGNFYGSLFRRTELKDLQENGNYYGSNGADNIYYNRLEISKEKMESVSFAEKHGWGDECNWTKEYYDNFIKKNYSNPAVWWEINYITPY